MKLIINMTSMVPIYEQICDSVKAQIRRGELKEGDILPSVRVLSREQRISALTVKKAYDTLEEEGFAVTVHGKGTYIARVNAELLHEETRVQLEAKLEDAVAHARRIGLTDEEIRSLFELIMEE